MSQPTPPPQVVPLRVVAAGADPAACGFYREALTALGHQAFVAASGRQAVDLCRAAPPDVLVVDAVLPDGGGLAVVAEVCRDRPAAVVLVSGPDGRATRGPGEGHVLAHLLAPVGPAQLDVAVGAAVRAFGRLRAAHAEVAELRQSVEERKLVERAKGLVARYAGLDEDAAYRRLRRLATDTNRKLIEVAREVLAAGEVFRALEQVADGPARNPGRVVPRWAAANGRSDGTADGHDGKGATP